MLMPGNKTGLIIWILAIQIVVSLFCSYFGIGASGTDFSSSAPTNFIDVVLGGITFMFNLLTFSITESIPYLVTIFFWFLNVVLVWAVVLTVRGD